MTNLELENLGFVPAGPVAEHEVTGGFCCDLLSWAMGRAKEGDAWFTVMGNVNAVAVASLADCACIVLCHGAQLDEVARQRAQENGVQVLATGLPEFEASLALAKAMGL